jgi:hypothetical protein
MSDEKSVPIISVVVYALWVFTSCWLVAGWACLATGEDHLALMLAMTAIMFAAIAATVTVSTFALRTQTLIRIANGLDSSNDPRFDSPGLKRV